VQTPAECELQSNSLHLMGLKEVGLLWRANILKAGFCIERIADETCGGIAPDWLKVFVRVI
jgi:hypothetical protein